MNCIACQEQLCLTLDGVEAHDRSALDRHLHDCRQCRAYREAARRLQTGLKLLRPPVPPEELVARVVDAWKEDRRRIRRKQLRIVIGLAVAASVAIVAIVRLWPEQQASQNPAPVTTVKKTDPQPEPPTPQLARTTPRESMESAVEAVAALTTRTTTETMEQTRKLMPLVEPPMPDLTWGPSLQTLSFPGAGHAVSEGLEPVTTHAKRAVGLLRRDMLPDF